MLNINNITLNKGNKQILKDISLALASCEKIGLVGVNGAGKSTLLKIIAGIEEPDLGSISFKGTTSYLAQETHKEMDINNYTDLTIGEYLIIEKNIEVEEWEIKKFLNQLTYPLYFLDFETFSSPIPLIDGSSPYQTIPFQFSLHVIEKDLAEDPKHYSWIWDAEGDPRLELLERLQSLLGNKGSILAYHSPFEMMILKQAVKAFPKYQKWLGKILERFVDLLQPFRAFHIYHPAQKGSCSLKDVLPALTGKDYSALEIQDGGQASRAFMGILNGEVDDKQAILANLEIYCGQDTMAMIEILRKMKTLTTL